MTTGLRAALQELVDCKDLKETVRACYVAATDAPGYALADSVKAEYERRTPLAWEAARAALAGAPLVGAIKVVSDSTVPPGEVKFMHEGREVGRIIGLDAGSDSPSSSGEALPDDALSEALLDVATYLEVRRKDHDAAVVRKAVAAIANLRRTADHWLEKAHPDALDAARMDGPKWEVCRYHHDRPCLPVLCEDGCKDVRSDAAPLDAARYYELLYAVASKYPGETRHETALRYIQERERAAGIDTGAKSDTAMSAAKEGKP